MGLVIITKVTNRCNLSCPYCSLSCSQSGNDLKPEEFFIFCYKIKRIYNLQRTGVEILFHGGEPTVIGANNLEKFIQIACIQFFDNYLKFTLQTNAYQIDDNLLKLINLYNIGIGASLDGDIYTNTKATPEQTKQIIENIKKLKTGIICVVSTLNKHNYINLYNIAKELNVGIKINGIFKSGRAELNWNKLKISPDDYYEYIKNIFSLWYEDNSEYSYRTSIDPIEDLLLIMYKQKPKSCIFLDICLKKFIEIQPTGEITPCGRLSDYVNLTIAKSPKELLPYHVSKVLHIFEQRKEYLKNTECRNCKYWEFCYGGCPSEGEDFFNKTMYCSSFKKMIGFLKREGIKMLKDKVEKFKQEFKKEPTQGVLGLFYKLEYKKDIC